MAQGAPKGWSSVTPRFFVKDSAEFVTFLRAAFGAKGAFRADGPSEIRLGDSLVMVSDARARGSRPAIGLYLYVGNIDAAYESALAAGATSIETPRETPYGDRRAIVRDPSGFLWQIATRMPPKKEADRKRAKRRRP